MQYYAFDHILSQLVFRPFMPFSLPLTPLRSPDDNDDDDDVFKASTRHAIANPSTCLPGGSSQRINGAGVVVLTPVSPHPQMSNPK